MTLSNWYWTKHTSHTELYNNTVLTLSNWYWTKHTNTTQTTQCSTCRVSSDPKFLMYSSYSDKGAMSSMLNTTTSNSISRSSSYSNNTIEYDHNAHMYGTTCITVGINNVSLQCTFKASRNIFKHYFGYCVTDTQYILVIIHRLKLLTKQ